MSTDLGSYDCLYLEEVPLSYYWRRYVVITLQSNITPYEVLHHTKVNKGYAIYRVLMAYSTTKLVTLTYLKNCIGDVMVSVLASSAIDRGFEPRWGQTKDYNIGICCFPVKHAALRRKSKYWLARNQNNVSKWGDMSTRGLLFQ